ncbi:RNase adapter RapZ [Flavimaricola marinus]|uniref:GlmZ(SRNA)-inactivating NTPase n=1 Tax=Flavimaricola marinus TaxID=1819565 RepID=A0A238LCW7_9RHOB|nr:RNase adapter RapZ [Flavimaricola marinus]SMY06760.1 glmZ(sRNA)-inactivating NTPase [Flavimaricola marinus]
MITPKPYEAPQRADDTRQRIVLVTGPSGAGRSTAVNALEDLGFEVIDNMPLSLLSRLMDGPPLARPLALGLDVRNRDFGVDALIDTMDQLAARPDIDDQVLYIDCNEDDLVRRYSETRRRHPLSPDSVPLVGIRQELELLVPIRARAHVLIDSSGITPHDLRAEISDGFGAPSGQKLGVTVQSFSFKRGLPRGLDIIQDVRFLRNPHWDPSLRSKDGRDPGVAAHIAGDPRFEEYFDKLLDMTLFLLPAYRDEGKTHLSIGIGCTGGQHRSVCLAERLADSLAENGWQVSKRHRELERRATAQTDTREQGAQR